MQQIEDGDRDIVWDLSDGVEPRLPVIFGVHQVPPSLNTVIARSGWDGRTDLEDAVRARVGNDCDVLVFTLHQIQQLARSGEPVASDILRDGISLIGPTPRATVGAF